MKKAAKKLSDKELQGLLASLKEDVAAPSNFRARVLKAVAAERGIAFDSAAASLRPGFLAVLGRAFSKPMLLPVAATAVLGFAVWFVAKPEGSLSLSLKAWTERGAEGARVEGQAKPASVSNPAPNLASVIKPAPQLSQKAWTERGAEGPRVEGQAQLAEQSSAKSAPVAAQVAMLPVPSSALKAPASLVPQIGSAGSAGAAAAPSVARAADIAPKPTIIVVTPWPTPVLKPLSGNSEVRRNKFLASRGEYAAVLYTVKASQAVRIEIYSRAGALVTVLQDGTQGAGQHEIHWFGYDDQGVLLPSGIYLLRIHSADYDERHKLVLIR